MLPHNSLPAVQPCYFSIPTSPPPQQQQQHWSDETPLASPSFDWSHPSPADPLHPLLALREFAPVDMAHSLMQRQTSAANPPSPSRHRHRPSLQNVLQVTSDDSQTSTSSFNSSSSVDATPSSPDHARCSRCQRTPSFDLRTGKTNMIQYGLNLWYCSRCAGMVGLQVDR